MNDDIPESLLGLREQYEKDRVKIELNRTPERHNTEIEMYRELYAEEGRAFNPREYGDNEKVDHLTLEEVRELGYRKSW